MQININNHHLHQYNSPNIIKWMPHIPTIMFIIYVNSWPHVIAITTSIESAFEIVVDAIKDNKYPKKYEDYFLYENITVNAFANLDMRKASFSFNKEGPIKITRPTTPPVCLLY